MSSGAAAAAGGAECIDGGEQSGGAAALPQRSVEDILADDSSSGGEEGGGGAVVERGEDVDACARSSPAGAKHDGANSAANGGPKESSAAAGKEGAALAVRTGSGNSSLIPSRAKGLTSYSSVGNREVVAPLAEIRAEFRQLTSPKRSRGKDGSAADEASSKSSNIQFAQVVSLDVLDSISEQLNRNAEFEEHGPGLPTAIAVHRKFIVVGTSRSVIIVFDHFQQISRVFCKGKVFDKLATALRASVMSEVNFGPVSAMDVVTGGGNENELLAVGYTRGRVELWDMVKCTLLRSLAAGPASHTCAINLVRFVATGGPRSNRFDTGAGLSTTASKKPFATVVCADTSGVVNMLVFSKTLMILSVECKCLLNGGAGQVVAMAACEELNMVALSSRRDTYLVSLDHALAKVVHQWPTKLGSADSSTSPPSPPSSSGNQALLPRLSWGSAKLSDEPNKAAIVLARAVGNRIDFLKTRVDVKVEKQRNGKKTKTPEAVVQLSRDYFEEGAAAAQVEADSSLAIGPEIVAIEWLNESLMAFVTKEYDLCILDVTGMAVVERTRITNVELVWTAFSTEAFSFQNSVRASGSTLYLLGIRQLSVARVQTWTQRVETLVLHNGWLEALALALDHYQLTGRRESEQDKMCDLILRFVTFHQQQIYADGTVQAQATTSSSSPPPPPPPPPSSPKHGERLAAACIEYCVEIDKTDLLFGPIYDVFTSSGRGGAFLALLEPYVLNRLLTRVPPAVLQDLVSEFVARGKKAELEQCILHLSPDTIRTDLHTLVSLCTEHKLLSGIVYLYNAGLNDFETPAQLLLDLHETERLLSYVETSFRGLTYPFGFPMDDPTSVGFVRVGLLGFLLAHFKPLARALLLSEGDASYNDIKELVGLIELGLGKHCDEWELRAVAAVQALDKPEAEKLLARRLLLHRVPGLADKDLVNAVLQRVIADGDEARLVAVLRNCDASLYGVDFLTEQIKAYGWNDALSCLHENALSAAIEDSNDLLRIRAVYEQIIRVSPTPARFALQELERRQGQLIVAQALEDAIRANLGRLLPSPPPPGQDAEQRQQALAAAKEERLCAQRVVLVVIRDSNELQDWPELQFMYLKKAFSALLAHADDDDHGPQGPQGPRDLRHAHDNDVAAAPTQSRVLPTGRFIELMCRFEPSHMFRFISDNDGLYPLDVALEVCQRHGIRDATSYLLERTGDAAGALAMTLGSLDSLDAMEDDDDHHQDANGLADDYGVDKRHAIVQSAVQLCERNSVIDLDTEHAESLWFVLLDKVSSLAAKAKANHKDRQPDHAARVPEPASPHVGARREDNHSAMLRNVLDAIMTHVDSETILFKLNSPDFGHMRHTIKCMIDARGYEKHMLVTAQKVASHDLITLVRRKHQRLGKATGQAFCRVVDADHRHQHRSQHTKPGRRNKPPPGWADQMQGLMPKPLNIDY